MRYHLQPPAVRQFIKERAAAAAGIPAAEMRGDGIAWFAERIDTSPSNLSRVINGRVPLTHDMGVRIANGLEVPHDVVYKAEFDPAPVEEIAS